MDFFKLAYLIEIAIVLNLAFRELKLHNLNKKVNEEIKKLQIEYVANELSIHYIILQSVNDEETAKKIKESEHIKEFWENKESLETFYNEKIRNGKALFLTNIYMILCIAILFFITLFSSWPSDFELESFRSFNDEWARYIFFSLLALLAIVCFLPIRYICLTNECEKFLFGDERENNPGKIKRLESALAEAKAAQVINMKNLEDTIEQSMKTGNRIVDVNITKAS